MCRVMNNAVLERWARYETAEHSCAFSLYHESWVNVTRGGERPIIQDQRTRVRSVLPHLS